MPCLDCGKWRPELGTFGTILWQVVFRKRSGGGHHTLANVQFFRAFAGQKGGFWPWYRLGIWRLAANKKAPHGCPYGAFGSSDLWFGAESNRLRHVSRRMGIPAAVPQSRGQGTAFLPYFRIRRTDITATSPLFCRHAPKIAPFWRPVSKMRGFLGRNGRLPEKAPQSLKIAVLGTKIPERGLRSGLGTFW